MLLSVQGPQQLMLAVNFPASNCNVDSGGLCQDLSVTFHDDHCHLYIQYLTVMKLITAIDAILSCDT